jgi:VWFA-related protein
MPASPRILASALLSLVLVSAPDSILGQQPVPDSKTVILRITAVDDHGRPIPGLKQEQFSVFEKKDQLQIASFDSNDEPASIAFIFDASGSVAPAFRAVAAQSAYQFTETSHRSNNYVVIAFDRQAQLLCGWDCRADDLKKAFAEVVRIVPQMNTALYDACDLALTKLETSKYGRRVIIVVSD